MVSNEKEFWRSQVTELIERSSDIAKSVAACSNALGNIEALLQGVFRQAVPLNAVKKPVTPLEKSAFSSLGLSTRSRNCLTSLFRTAPTVGELIKKSPDNLMAIKGFGRTSLNEIQLKLAKRHLTLAPNKGDDRLVIAG